MKNLRKLLIAVALCLLSLLNLAQTFGIKGGLNLTKMHVGDDYEISRLDILPEFHVGPTLELPVNELISVNTGFILSTKGFRDNETIGEGDDAFQSDTKVIVYYVDIPITVKGMFTMSDKILYGYLGPYIGAGLNGKIKSETTSNGHTEIDEEDVKFGSDADEDDIKRLDYGLTAGAGVEIKNALIELSYDLGIANISAYTEDGSFIKNRILKLSIGYQF